MEQKSSNKYLYLLNKLNCLKSTTVTCVLSKSHKTDL